MAGWAYILYEIFAGEAGRVAADEAPESVKSAFSLMRWIVTIGWAIYPLDISSDTWLVASIWQHLILFTT